MEVFQSEDANKKATGVVIVAIAATAISHSSSSVESRAWKLG